MSLILGIPAPQDKTVDPRLSSRGFNHLKSHVSTLRMYAAPTTVQIAFAEYKAHLPAFMWSCTQQSRADLREFAHPVTIALKDCVPIRYPTLSFALKEHSGEKNSAMLDLGGRVSKIRQTLTYQFERPTSETLKAILKLDIDKTCQANDECINFSAFDSFRITLKVFSEFLIVHRYPAFIDPGHESSHLVDRTSWQNADDSAPASSSAGKRKRSDEDEGDKATHLSIKKGGLPSMPSENSDNIAPTANKWYGSQIVLKKIPEKAHHPWVTTPTDLPVMYGIWSPYVFGLQHYDIDKVPRVVCDYFLGSLGLGRSACLAQMEKFKADWGVIGNTEAGKELSHMAFCIDAAIRCQARVIPLITPDKIYQGCAIMGYGFEIILAGTSYRPVPYDEVLKQIDETVTHKKLLGDILKKVGLSGDVDDGMSEVGKVVTDPTFKMMHLRSLCLTKPVAESQKVEIAELAKGLDFRQVSWSTNPTTITYALELISNISTKLPDTLPIHHSMLFSTDRLSVVWSCFGFTSPSFRPVAAKLVSLTDKTFDYPVTIKGTEKKVETRPFDHMHVRFTTLPQAIEDLELVRSSGKIGVLVNPSREANNANRRFDKENFTKIKDALNAFAGTKVDKGKGKVIPAKAVDNMLEMDDEDL